MEPRPASPKILVVEDDPSLAKLAQAAFRSLAAEVVVHGRSFGVLQLIATEHPDVLLLDVMMPGLDGPSLVELIRQDPELAGTRVVLWSALDGAELERRGRECGADGVIEKVAGPARLVAQISEWLRDWALVDSA